MLISCFANIFHYPSLHTDKKLAINVLTAGVLAVQVAVPSPAVPDIILITIIMILVYNFDRGL